MLPYLFNNEKFATYGIMMFVGIGACFLLIIFVDKTKRIKKDDKLYGGIITALGGLIGAKLLSFLMSIPLIISKRVSIMGVIRGGFVFYGGLIGGVIAIIIYCKASKIKLIDFFDLAAFALPIGQMFGRIGCFLGGCCYGKTTDSFLGVIYHVSADPNTPLGVKILPTQLFEAAYCLAIFFVLFYLNRKKVKSGAIAATYMVLYSVCRFINEMFRGDDVRGFLLGLSTSQFISIFIFWGGILLFYLTYFYKGGNKNCDKPKDLSNNSDNEKTSK